MKKRKWYKFDKKQSESNDEKVLDLLKLGNIKKLKKMSLPEFFVWVSDSSEDELNTSSIIRVYNYLKTGVL